MLFKFFDSNFECFAEYDAFCSHIFFLIFSSLSFCHEKAAEALCVGQIQTRLGVCLCFLVFPVEFSSDFFNLLLARFHQAEIIIVMHLIQGRNNVTRLGLGWDLNH